jgi:hypothetical protein
MRRNESTMRMDEVFDKIFVYFRDDDAVGSVVRLPKDTGGLVRGVMRCYMRELQL